MQNFRTYDDPFWEKSNRDREKKIGEGENAVNSGHHVLPATPKGSACTLLGPKDARVFLILKTLFLHRSKLLQKLTL